MKLVDTNFNNYSHAKTLILLVISPIYFLAIFNDLLISLADRDKMYT